MKYKVGDKVRVRQYYPMAKQYGVENGVIKNGGDWFVRDMRKYCGQVVTIRRVCNDYYYIKEDVKHYWQDWMFEGFAFEWGDKILVRDSDDKKWIQMLYLGYIDGVSAPYFVSNCIEKFNASPSFLYRQAKPYPEKHTIVLDGKELEISDESYKEFKEFFSK